MRRRLGNIFIKLKGYKHYFIYFVFDKATQGVYEEIKRWYAVSRSREQNMVMKPVRHNNSHIIIKDIRKYIETRLEKILNPRMYSRSNGYIFSYLKRLVEYLLILDSLLLKQDNLAQQIAYISHNTSQYHVTKYLNILKTINDIDIQETNKNTKKIRTSPIPTPYI